jgi:hypothetical protein
MFVPVGVPFESARDTVAQFIAQCPPLLDLGLPEEFGVFQADTAESPSTKPFVVIRWGEQETTNGISRVHPFDLWVYDEFGDYGRASRMSKILQDWLPDNAVQVPTLDGRLSQISARGIGGDLADDGFGALVVPGHFAANVVGS